MKRSLAAIGLVVAVQAVAGCDSPATPSAPSRVPEPTSASGPATSSPLVSFADPHSGFSTTDLYDAHEQGVQFTVAHELIWVTDGRRLGGYDFYGNSISVPGCACSLVVRFGTRDGQRRAYLTADYIHDNPGTLVSLGISGTALTISSTTLFAPGTYTLSGVISETSENGLRPAEGATVWRLNEEQSGWQLATTDKNGFYEMHGLYDGERQVALIKDGYVTATSAVRVKGDTRFDGEIVRR